MISTRLPRHIAIIMDGNGRWAQRRGRPRVFGHIRGAKRVREIVRAAGGLGIEALTLYAFSTENWARPESEKETLWQLLRKFLSREVDELAKQNVRLRIIGEVDRLPADLQAMIAVAEEKLASNTGLRLNLALSYGARRELLRAARIFAERCAQGLAAPGDLSESTFGDLLWTSVLGDLAEVDLVIRTSGEKRISNFLLWQSAYAEYYFTDVCWPDFGTEKFEVAVREFMARSRRFGGVNVAAPAPMATAVTGGGSAS